MPINPVISGNAKAGGRRMRPRGRNHMEFTPLLMSRISTPAGDGRDRLDAPAPGTVASAGPVGMTTALALAH